MNPLWIHRAKTIERAREAHIPGRNGDPTSASAVGKRSARTYSDTVTPGYSPMTRRVTSYRWGETGWRPLG